MDDEEPNIVYARRIADIAERLLHLAQDVALLDLSPSDLSALVYAESESLRLIAEELKD